MVYAVVLAWLVLAAIVVLTWGRLDTDRGWRGFVLALTLGLSLLHQLLFATVTEDAFITFRYAQNIADGNGPVFNPARILWDRWLGEDQLQTVTPPEGFPVVKAWPG